MRDDQSPLSSPNTRVIAAALASGADFASEKPLLDSIDHAGKRQVVWSMSGKGIDFEPNFEAETVDFAEFARRFESLEWCKANEDHPIAFLRAFSDKMNRLRDRLRAMKPMVRVQDGKRIALIPADASAAEKKEILGML